MRYNFFLLKIIMHPSSRPEGLRRCPGRGSAGGVLVFSFNNTVTICTGCAYLPGKINVSKIGCSHSTVESLSCVYIAGKLMLAKYNPVTVF